MRKVLILIAAAALLCTSVPAMAADWEFFGVANFRTQWRSANTESRDNMQVVDSVTGVAAQKSDGDLEWDRMVTGALGATVQAGAIGGKFMWRVLEASGNVDTTAGNMAEFYGTWDFGMGQLLVGKTLGPVNFFPSAQVSLDDFGLVGLGGLLSYFKPMLQGSFPVGPGQLKVALLAVETQQLYNPFNTPSSWQNSLGGSVLQGGTPGVAAPVQGAAAASPGAPLAYAFTDMDVSVPKIEASYQFDIGSHSFWIGGGYQTYDGVNFASANGVQLENDVSIDSYVFGIGWLTNWGPFYFNGDVFIGQNGDQYQMTFQQGNDAAYYDPTTNTIYDNKQLGFSVVAGWKFNDMLKVEAGYGYLQNKLDAGSFINSAGVLMNDPEDDMWMAYIQLPITLSPGMMIIPEITYADWRDNEISPRPGTGLVDGSDDEGTTTYFGACWRITF